LASRPRTKRRVVSVEQFDRLRLIVAADGLNSLVRRASRAISEPRISYSANKFAWYGTTKRFETLSQTFVKTDLGTFNAHHYRYSPTMSNLPGRMRFADLAAIRLCRQNGR